MTERPAPTAADIRIAVESYLDTECIVVPCPDRRVIVFYFGITDSRTVVDLAKRHLSDDVPVAAYQVVDLLAFETEARRLLPIYQWCCWSLIAASLVATIISVLT